MNQVRLEKIYVVVLMVILAGIVLHAPFTVIFSTFFPEVALFAKSWKEILMAGLIPVAAAIITRRELWAVLWRDWLLRTMGAYVALHVFLAALLHQSVMATLAGLAIDLRYMVFFVLLYVALLVMPEYRLRMIKIVVVGLFIVVCFATIQLFLPPDALAYIGYNKNTIIPYLTVDKNPQYIRVNSTLRGPNPLGAYAAMMLGPITAALVHAKLNFRNKKVVAGATIVSVCCVIALWVSYSRSALVAGLVVAGIVLVPFILKGTSRRMKVLLVAVVVVVVGGLVVERDSSFVSNILLHENPSNGIETNSNKDHMGSLEYGVRQLVREPLGSGIGSTGSASLFTGNHVVVENQYLFIAHEAGWIGLALFLAIVSIVLVRLWHRRLDWLALGTFAGGVGLMLIGLLLPVWADDTVSIVWWGMAAIALSQSGAEISRSRFFRA